MTYSEIEEERNFGIYGNAKAELEEEMMGEQRAIDACASRGFFSRLVKKCVCGYHA